jgi:hypothetical protein
MLWLSMLNTYIPTQLHIICKSPFPRTQIAKGSVVQDGSFLEDILLRGSANMTAQTGRPSDRTGHTPGVFIKALGQEAFAKHMESLESS